MSRIPTTQALRALDAFARLGTIWQAADELNLTKSAVSHQLRQLERDLGFPLTARAGTRLELTPPGRVYAADIRRALDILSSSAEQSAGRGVSGRLVVSVPPGFASNWLCTMIEGFAQSYPGIGLQIVTPRRLDDASSPDVDVFICFGREIGGNVEVELLKRIDYTPFCSPAYLYRFDRFRDPSALGEATLLHLVDHVEWADWMRVAGLPADHANRGIVFGDMTLVFAAALAGQGIAMGDEFVCADALASGKLVRPFEREINTERAYWLAIPRDRARSSAGDAFLNWLRTAMRNA